MKSPKILVVGSFVMDQIVTTCSFPREGQTVLGNGFRKAPGGKGANQAVQMARLGADVTMIGKLGRDANGEELLRTCIEAGIDTKYVLYDENAPTGCAVIILEEQAGHSVENRIIVIPGANKEIKPGDIEFLEDTIAQYDIVVLQLEIPLEINLLVARYAYAKGVPVMLNSAPSTPLSHEFMKYLTYISPNEHEACDLTGIHIRHDGRTFELADVKAAAEFLKKMGVDNILITLGSAGAVLFNKDGMFSSPCADGICAVDPTAAGDSFVGAFCVGTCCGWDWKDVLLFANHAAGLTVSAMGAMPSLPELATVEDFLLQRTGIILDTTMLKE